MGGSGQCGFRSWEVWLCKIMGWLVLIGKDSLIGYELIMLSFLLYNALMAFRYWPVRRVCHSIGDS